ncbi:hypothetical protein ATCC90586_004521 [Pythium insidiosum]|nr:hypothetical protein ATCC90586_004521 [Pythium insidiosum]
MAVVELTSLKSFPQLWKELRKLGWTAKRPTGLGVDYRYVPPSSSGGSVNGEEGRNVFTAQPTEDADDSEVEDEGVLDMLFDAYDDDETGEEVDDGEADRCDIDDDKDVLREMSRVAMARHWSTQEDGAVPRGTFGRFMSRSRFEDIVRFLHFNNNSDTNHLRDRAWKVRPVLQVVEKTFRRGFLLGKTISFDEGMVGSRHRMNPMRVYMKGKPTKWGTKFYMTCCAETAYCARVEICCRGDDSDNTITRAVIRNVSKTLQGLPVKRLIVTDNYYSSITLSRELLKRGYYHVGTYRTNRLGWPAKGFSYNFNTRPKKTPRGTYRIAVNKTTPELVAVSWCDSRSVQVIATGCSSKPTTIRRREKNGNFSDVVCPQLIVDYQKGMGGVDQHDQLRLHRYSIQKSLRMQKYYKSVFLGIVDMAIVNGYIVHRFERQAQGKSVPTHADYIIRLHQELLAVTKVDMSSHLVAENLVSAPTQANTHALSQTTEIYKGKLRQYMCKVCSALSDKKQRCFETSYFCEMCGRTKGGSVWLCNKVRPGQTLTCSQIWHDNWKNGTLIPPELRGRIRFCKRKLVNKEGSEALDGPE